MRTKLWTCLGAAIVLAGCKPMSAAAPEVVGHGRYAGIGIYTPGEPWRRVVATQQAKDTPAARPIDDQAIIVVVDSVSGEVRACGDLTGYCVGMNPWKTPLAASQIAPINLTEHVRAAQPVEASPSASPRIVAKPLAPADSTPASQ